MRNNQKRTHCSEPCPSCPYRTDADKKAYTREEIAFENSQVSMGCRREQNAECAGHMLMNGNKNFYVRILQRIEPDYELSGRELIFKDAKSLLAHYPKQESHNIHVAKTSVTDSEKMSNEERTAIKVNASMKLFMRPDIAKKASSATL